MFHVTRKMTEICKTGSDTASVNLEQSSEHPEIPKPLLSQFVYRCKHYRLELSLKLQMIPKPGQVPVLAEGTLVV
jgi:hypothetical protein